MIFHQIKKDQKKNINVYIIIILISKLRNENILLST